MVVRTVSRQDTMPTTGMFGLAALGVHLRLAEALEIGWQASAYHRKVRSIPFGGALVGEALAVSGRSHRKKGHSTT